MNALILTPETLLLVVFIFGAITLSLIGAVMLITIHHHRHMLRSEEKLHRMHNAMAQARKMLLANNIKPPEIPYLP